MGLIPTGSTVTVETKWFPPLIVDISGQGGPPGLVTRALQPKVTVKFGATTVATVAPAGEPFPSQWPKVKIGLAVAVGVLVFSVLRIIR